jgi:hypothetical protein
MLPSRIREWGGVRQHHNLFYSGFKNDAVGQVYNDGYGRRKESAR